MKKVRQSYLRIIFTFFFLLFSLFFCYGQVASRSDGVNVFYYDSFFEAVVAATAANAAVGVSIEQPDEITLLADIVLDAPLTVDDGVHIRLVPGAGLQGGHRTIRRSGSLIEFPVIWVKGDSASLSLGKPGMGFELVIDGGRLNSPPIEAHCPLVAVSGPGSKLIMYDGVTLQNNLNNGAPTGTSHYENGAGVFIRTEGDVTDRQAEFIMKGGTIRGNVNDLRTAIACGGGVFIAGFGVFTMEGGVIMNNTARFTGGGFHTGGRGAFKKTGGIIYGSNAPAAYRNTALKGFNTPKNHGHAVWVSILKPPCQFRDDTVGENDNLSYIGVPRGGSVLFGREDKWDNPDKALRRMLVAVILPVLALTVCGFLFYRKRYLKKLNKIVQEAADKAADAVSYIDLENMGLTNREKEICELLLTDCNLKEIATVLQLTYAGAGFHSRNLYKKLGIKGRTELLVRVKSNEQRASSKEQS